MLSAFTAFHVLLSLIGIASGLVVMFGFLTARSFGRVAMLFLITTAATSVTGFLFPFHGFMPSYALGGMSLIVLAVAFAGWSRTRRSEGWRKLYVVTCTIALYLNVFVLVVQMFEKIPALHVLAPTQADPPFQITEAVLLVVFVALGIRATMKFRSDTPMKTRAAGA